ncbi:MAG: hypothetical protein Q7R87_01110 [Nanoarchaeota archaeon]|nr:hypothetical protein [Nanoarchaeota archaeon]
MQNKIKERKEQVIKTSNPFVDGRGRIDNYELIFPVNMANIITSKSNTIRANHYHPEQLQQVLIISGKYISVYKDLTNPDSEIKTHIVEAGDLVVTPPMIAHTMIFLEDCIFINLVPGNRDHDKFGTHTVPYELVKKEEIGDYIKKNEVNNQ